MSTALVKPVIGAQTSLFPRDPDDAFRMAERLAKSNLVPKEFRGKPEDVFLVITFGAELGLPPVAALRGMMCINGRPAPYAATLVGVVQASPACKYLRCVSSNNEEATYETLRVGYPSPSQESFTMADAQRAGLTQRNQNYQLYPRKMLEARASAALARKVYADICAGVYVAEEVEDFEESAPRADAKFIAPPSKVIDVAPDAANAEVAEHVLIRLAQAKTSAEFDAAKQEVRASVKRDTPLYKLCLQVRNAHQEHVDRGEGCVCEGLAKSLLQTVEGGS